MFIRSFLTFASWLLGFVGWCGGCAVGFALGISTCGAGWSNLQALSPDDGLYIYVLILLFSGLGRVLVSGTLHAVGTALLAEEQRGTPWLRGVVLGVASPSIFGLLVTVQLVLPYTYEFALASASNHNGWVSPATEVGTWILGIGCSAALAALGGMGWRRRDRREINVSLDAAAPSL